MSLNAPLVLLTDFGLQGPYVGQMKGVLAQRAPGHPVIDLTHEVGPQDVREGAFLLEVSWRYFPVGSVFIAVVDPGVGTERAPVALACEGRGFVGPDNGLLTGALPPDAELQAVRLENPQYRLPVVSSTFHGRDLFAPAGAALATGTPLDELGPVMGPLVSLPDRFPVMTQEEIKGRIVHVDRFGNLVSNVSRTHFEEWTEGAEADNAAFHIGEKVITGLKQTYGEARMGELLALFGSLGYLEIAVNGGNAAQMLGVGRGAELVVRRKGDWIRASAKSAKD